jgi:hypothetical protein
MISARPTIRDGQLFSRSAASRRAENEIEHVCQGPERCACRVTSTAGSAANCGSVSFCLARPASGYVPASERRRAPGRVESIRRDRELASEIRTFFIPADDRSRQGAGRANSYTPRHPTSVASMLPGRPTTGTRRRSRREALVASRGLPLARPREHPARRLRHRPRRPLLHSGRERRAALLPTEGRQGRGVAERLFASIDRSPRSRCWPRRIA